jgi:putative SOS response-associated peptidase YedK
MCGRVVSTSRPDDLARYFSADLVPECLLEPCWNVAPSSDVWTVVEAKGARLLHPRRWGLVPAWAEGPATGNRLINARAETLATSGAYRQAFTRRRCLIAVDGFYEWERRPAGRSQPWFLHRPDGEPLAFAGLWERWWGPDGAELRSCTIVTGEPNETVAPLHDRMPVILPPRVWADWLDPANDDLAGLERVLIPAPAELLTARPVGPGVNDVRNDGPHLLDEARLPVEAALSRERRTELPGQTTLW